MLKHLLRLHRKNKFMAQCKKFLSIYAAKSLPTNTRFVKMIFSTKQLLKKDMSMKTKLCGIRSKVYEK